MERQLCLAQHRLRCWRQLVPVPIQVLTGAVSGKRALPLITDAHAFILLFKLTPPVFQKSICNSLVTVQPA